ncbi:unnamed protein product [Symbiodinium necroappetens]|uniref:Uncharacterized protein n=1 Tax=Symbiodinium necroappetens TaxID=1628268 RepID=A0A813BJR6_9DINO|nr:unnamed protein product [Symbiodinium necroappetens]
MALDVEPVVLTGLGSAWFCNEEIRERLSMEAPTALVVPASGDRTVAVSQETAVMNDMFLIPIIIQMKAAKSLKIPSLEDLASELEGIWVKLYEASQKKASRGRFPKMPCDFKLPDHVQALCISDAKNLKSLLSMVKKQFQSERIARDADYRRLVASFGDKAGYPELVGASAHAETENEKPEKSEPKPPSQTAAKTFPKPKKTHEFGTNDDEDDCLIVPSASGDTLAKMGKRAQLAAKIERL